MEFNIKHIKRKPYYASCTYVSYAIRSVHKHIWKCDTNTQNQVAFRKYTIVVIFVVDQKLSCFV